MGKTLAAILRGRGGRGDSTGARGACVILRGHGGSRFYGKSCRFGHVTEQLGVTPEVRLRYFKGKSRRFGHVIEQLRRSVEDLSTENLAISARSGPTTEVGFRNCKWESCRFGQASRNCGGRFQELQVGILPLRPASRATAEVETFKVEIFIENKNFYFGSLDLRSCSASWPKRQDPHLQFMKPTSVVADWGGPMSNIFT